MRSTSVLSYVPSPPVVRASRADLRRLERKYGLDVRRASTYFSSCGAAAGSVIGPVAAAGAGGGPTTSPSWIAKGTDADTSSGATYGTNLAGDLFVLMVAGRATAMSTPSGWTLQAGPNTQAASRSCWLFTRDARSTGSETGSVTTSVTGGSYLVSIHTFRNVATSSFVEDPSNGGRSDNGTGPLPPAITSAGAHRLAVFAGGGGGDANATPPTITATGGTWVERYDAATGTGTNCDVWLFTCDLAAAGTITGGDGGGGTNEHSCVGFALVGV